MVGASDSRPYIALAPSDDAFRRSGSAPGEGSLWPLYRGTRGDISRNRNARRLASRVGGHDAGMRIHVVVARGHQRALSVRR
eukprot:1653765-Prymnesium_polylepis.1